VRSIRDTPIRQKLMASFAFVTGSALLVTAIVLVVADWLQIRRDATHELEAQAALIGANSSAAIEFGDSDTAAQILGTLSAIPDITHAVLYDLRGNLIASYANDDHDTTRPLVPDHPEDDMFSIFHRELVVVQAIRLDGDRIGTVVLQSDMHSGYAGLRRNVWATLGIAIGAFGLALLVAGRLQRLITVPILSLAEMVQQVSHGAAYSLRAPVEGEDEVGRLARGVNAMLETVQRRDQELAGHQSRLESLVAERTSDLEQINERLMVELDEHEQAQARLTRAVSELERHRHENELLTDMNDRLQVCRDVSEVGPVIALYGPQLFPGSSGSVHLFNEERSRMMALVHWGEGDGRQELDQDDCWALRRGQLHAVAEPGSELVCPHVGAETPAGGYLCIPMIAQGNLSGLLHVGFESPPEGGKPTPLDRFDSLAESAAERAAAVVASLQLRARLREQSVHDPLTGLHNRRYMEESFEREISRAKRNEIPLAVAMLDLDHFKDYNDRYGHDAGDVLLRQLGDLLRRSVRVEDVACRFGGEEFTLIMPSLDAEGAQRRAEQICEQVRALRVEHQGQRIGDVTISIGVAIFPGHGGTADELIRAADAALYEAKSAGRDRVQLYAGASPPDGGATPSAAGSPRGVEEA